MTHIWEGAPSRAHLTLFGAAIAASLVAVLLVPRAAHASFVDCVGSAVHSDKTDRSKFDYAFRCSEPISGYTIISSQAIDSFGTETVVTDQSGATMDKESFSCEGLLPSTGFGCNGSMDSLHTVKSDFATDSDPCGKVAAKTPFKLWAVVFATDTQGDGKTVMKPSGPLPLSVPKCPKAHKKHSSRHH